MALRLILRPDPPFRLDLTVWALRRRPRNAIDRWHGTQYSRILLIDDSPIHLAVKQIAPVDRPELEVVCIHQARRLNEERVRGVVEKLLGLNTDLSGFYRLAACDRHLRTLAERFVGFRPPRFPTVFEAAVNAISCQQLSLEAGLTVLNRLVAHSGARFSRNDQVLFAFPKPCDIARLTPGALRKLGFSRQKAAALLDLARILAADEDRLEALTSLDDGLAAERLMELKGIGRWSAEYILLRGLGRLSVFPGDDVGGQNSLRRLMGLSAKRTLRYDQVRAILRHWAPFQGLIYFHLLLANLEEAAK